MVPQCYVSPLACFQCRALALPRDPPAPLPENYWIWTLAKPFVDRDHSYAVFGILYIRTIALFFQSHREVYEKSAKVTQEFIARKRGLITDIVVSV